MNYKNFALLLLSLSGFLFTANANAQTVLDGQSDGGAYFRIVVPDVWNGDLVIWNHGFSLGPIGPVTDLGPLRDVHSFIINYIKKKGYQTIIGKELYCFHYKP